MKIINATDDVLKDAVSKLQLLGAKAFEIGNFDEVAKIVALAKNVSSLINGGIEMTDEDISMSDIHPSLVLKTKTKTNTKRRVTYPRFMREDDTLLKIGWSKKYKSEYEHRAESKIIDCLISAIRAIKKDGEYFVVPDVLPVYSADKKTKFADYQIYLVLKWLFQEGAIIKKGRDKYAIALGRADKKDINTMWDMLPKV